MNLFGLWAVITDKECNDGKVTHFCRRKLRKHAAMRSTVDLNWKRWHFQVTVKCNWHSWVSSAQCNARFRMFEFGTWWKFFDLFLKLHYTLWKATFSTHMKAMAKHTMVTRFIGEQVNRKKIYKTFLSLVLKPTHTRPVKPKRRWLTFPHLKWRNLTRKQSTGWRVLCH